MILATCFGRIGASAQDQGFVSIHEEQCDYYSQFGDRDIQFYDSVNGFTKVAPREDSPACSLQKVVFGYHPYWIGSAYLNYQWNLVSDLCYFSYEVDPATGDAISIHNWLTDPAIDSALAHGVRVHLCVTLFSNHATFLNNPAARQNLAGNLVALLQQRNGKGVNIDFEAVPASLSESLTSFIVELSGQLKASIPAAMLSIAIPAIDWNHVFDLAAMETSTDLFMIMGYDYYWNGSSEAGPVTPLYALTPGYDFSLARTAGEYASMKTDPAKLVLGIPYYGRQWKTKYNSVPSSIVATGTALTYANVRNNGGGNYNPQNLKWEPNSFSSYYVFFQNDNWNQCFIGLDRDVRNWYEMVNYFGLAGIGIWALGYDNGYPDLWQAISDKFTDCFIPLPFDTLYDCGGPAWNYYPGSDYTMTIDQGYGDTRWLTLNGIHLEEGHDSLWLYAGKDTLGNLLGSVSGEVVPVVFSSGNGAFTLRFRSDFIGNRPGWIAIFHDGTLGMESHEVASSARLSIFPNPAADRVTIGIPIDAKNMEMTIYDGSGREIAHYPLSRSLYTDQAIDVNLAGWPQGIYRVVLKLQGSGDIHGAFIKNQ